MEGEFDNPIGRVLSLFREIDEKATLQPPLSETVTKRELTEAMLVLSNMQMAQLNLVMATMRNDKDAAERYATVLTAQLSSVIEVAVGVGGDEFLSKVTAEVGNGSE